MQTGVISKAIKDLKDALEVCFNISMSKWKSLINNGTKDINDYQVIHFGDKAFALKTVIVKSDKYRNKISTENKNVINVTVVENREGRKGSALYEGVITKEDIIYNFMPTVQHIFSEVLDVLRMEYGYFYIKDLAYEDDKLQALIEYYSDLIIGEEAEKVRGRYGEYAVKLSDNIFMLLYVNRLGKWTMVVKKYAHKKWCKNWCELAKHQIEDMRNLEYYIKDCLNKAHIKVKEV